MPKKEAPLKEKNGPPEEKKGPPEMTYGSQIYHGSPKVLRGTQGVRTVYCCLVPQLVLNILEFYGSLQCSISLVYKVVIINRVD